ncbi:MAG: glutaredoxin family protein [Bryobacterales bacterium]|nr:glutaredoxin family protein [Bryobacterales bacterium]
MVTVRFYTRRGCHLCHTAEAALRAEQSRTPFTLDIFDIDADPDLQDLYNLLVPVTVLPNGDEMHYRVDTGKLRAALATS